MNRFFQLIKKNLVVLFRAKSTALIMILAPMFIIFLLGIAFDNTNTYALNIGTYDPNPSKTTNSFIDKLKEKQYRVVPVLSEDQCVEMIKDGSLHTCIVFPGGFSLQETEKNEITFYVDYGRINLVYIIMETLTNKISDQTKDISVNLTNILLDKLDNTRKEIFIKRPLLSSIGKRNKEINEKINSVTKDMSNLDLSLSPMNLAQIMVSDEAVVDDSINAIRKYVVLARSEVHSAESSASGFTNPDGTNPVMDQLRQAKGSLRALEETISNELAPVKASISQVKIGLGQAEIQMDSAKTKLDTVALFREIANSAGTEISQKTNDIVKDVQTLQAVFETIDQNIGSIQIKNAADIVNPISTSIKAVNSSATHLNYIFPSLLVLILMFISIILAITLVIMEKNSPASFRNAITPVNDSSFIGATFATTVLLVFIQAVVMILVAGTAFSIPLYGSLGSLIIGILLTIFFFTTLGMVIGYIFNSEEMAMLSGISIGALMLFFSNVIVPLETIPANILKIIQFSPFILSESIIRKVAFYNLNFTVVQNDIIYLVSYTIILFLVAYILQSAIRKHFAHRWAHIQKQKMLTLTHLIKPAEAINEPEKYIIPDEILLTDDNQNTNQYITEDVTQDKSKKKKQNKK